MILNYLLSSWSFEAYQQPETLDGVCTIARSAGYGVELWPTCKGEGLPPPPEPLSFGEYLAEVNKKNYDLPAS